MTTVGFEWLEFASHLDGPGFARFQRGLANFNRGRLEPSLPEGSARDDIEAEWRVRAAELQFVETMRRQVAEFVTDIPDEVDRFIGWFERLRETGPGQGDPLFPWLAAEASAQQMRWFIEQEVAGEKCAHAAGQRQRRREAQRVERVARRPSVPRGNRDHAEQDRQVPVAERLDCDAGTRTLGR